MKHLTEHKPHLVVSEPHRSWSVKQHCEWTENQQQCKWAGNQQQCNCVEKKYCKLVVNGLCDMTH